jgi:hypothetical protein
MHGCWINNNNNNNNDTAAAVPLSSSSSSSMSTYSIGALVNAGAVHLQELWLCHNNSRIDRHAAVAIASAIAHNNNNNNNTALKVLDLTRGGTGRWVGTEQYNPVRYSRL